jgi:hypothetical protein
MLETTQGDGVTCGNVTDAVRVGNVGTRGHQQQRRSAVAEGFGKGMLSVRVVQNLVGLLNSGPKDTCGSAVGLLDFCVDHAEQQVCFRLNLFQCFRGT